MVCRGTSSFLEDKQEASVSALMDIILLTAKAAYYQLVPNEE